jgi:hypothetical protein
LQFQVQGQDQILAARTLALGQQLAAQFAPRLQPFRRGAIEVLAGGRLDAGGAELGMAVANAVGEGRAMGIAAPDLAVRLLAVGQHLAAPVQDAAALDAVGRVELAPVVGLHEGEELGPEDARKLPASLMAQHGAEEQEQAQGRDQQGFARRTQVARLRLAAKVMDPLEEKKGHHKEAPVQTYPQIGPGRRVHQGGEEFGDVQRVLREEDPRQPCLTLAKGRQGSSQGVGQGMETIGE